MAPGASLGSCDRVFAAYGHHCAVCGLQLELVEAAHIVPVASQGSTDETSNGLSLCGVHHKAYDTALLGVLPDYSVALSGSRLRALSAREVTEGLPDFTQGLRPRIVVPPGAGDWPRPQYLETGLAVRGWVE